jgi:hypothetical protein
VSSAGIDQVIRAVAGNAAVLASIAERQRDFDAVCRSSIARLVAADRSAAGLMLSGLWPRSAVPCEQEEAAP